MHHSLGKLQTTKEEGLSLIELLVVVTIFAVLGVIVTRSVLLTLQGSKKTEGLVKVRENLNFAMGIIERQVRNADSIDQCPNPDLNILNYTDSQGNPASFSCVNPGQSNAYVASGSASLTNDNINILDCKFVCTPGNSLNPSSVTIDLTGTDKSAAGVPGATVSLSNKIFLRNY